MNDNCSICNEKIDEDNGDIRGHFGVKSVAFCVWCLSSILDLARQLRGEDDE